MRRAVILGGTLSVLLAFLGGMLGFSLVAPTTATAHSSGAQLSPEPLGEAWLTGVVAVASLASHNVALRQDGTVWEWRTYHQTTAQGDPLTHSPAFEITGVREVRAVASGDGFRLALRADGTVWAWGTNFAGQLGRGTRQGPTAPAPVVDLRNVVAVAAGSAHSLALDSDGSVSYWGQGASGDPGDTLLRPQTRPAPVLGLPAIVAIAAKDRHSLALDTEGRVWAWDHGSLEESERPSEGIHPVRVVGLDQVIRVAAGTGQHLAVKADGTVWAWSPFVGEVPAPVAGLADVVAVAIGEQHQSALTAEGTIWSWGPMWTCARQGTVATATNLVQVRAAGGTVGLAAGDCYTLGFDGQGELASLPATGPFALPIAGGTERR